MHPEFKVGTIEWDNTSHPDLILWGIFTRSSIKSPWRWYCLITDDRDYADKFLKQMH